ncbi:MAG: cyclopropane fatty acyl phospholipid synthase, partial [Pantoea sp.]|nr:cyclopropane fatty acyl phospholipid synthase [Pantoea sp.]
MSTSCIEEVNLEENHWYRIVHELLEMADIEINGKRPWDIQVNNPDFFKRVLQEGSLGLGESYMDGWWDCERLDIFFQRVLKHQLDQKLPHHFKDTLRIAAARLTNLQSKKRAWMVGKEHYDLGNDLFSLMLDPFMQYSCGYWKSAQTLEEAQQAKLTLICEKLKLKPGMKLLDIGCGWGGLAEFAARHYGVTVDGVTISAEQQKMAQQRCAGLDVNILLQDYRDLDNQYDRIVSVGMFEHVGPKNYATYFNVVDRNLKPDGLFLLHTIGAIKTDMHVDPWIDKYIFP